MDAGQGTLYRGFKTSADIDAQYRIAHSDAELVAGRTRAQTLSAQALGSLQHTRVRFGATLEEYLDIFPAATPGAPVLVFFHGGYWRALSAADYSFVALGPMAMGITTVVVNYALAPWVTLDEIGRQARASVAWVMDNIKHYGGDSQRVVLSGHSAGGQLAAHCLAAPWRSVYGIDPCGIRAAVLISGVFDLAPLRYSFLQPQLQLDDGAVLRNSPILHIRGNMPPVLATVGSKESSEFKRQTSAFISAYHAQGNEAHAVTLKDVDHFQAVEPLLDSTSMVCKWIAQHVGSGESRQEVEVP